MATAELAGRRAGRAGAPVDPSAHVGADHDIHCRRISVATSGMPRQIVRPAMASHGASGTASHGASGIGGLKMRLAWRQTGPRGSLRPRNHRHRNVVSSRLAAGPASAVTSRSRRASAGVRAPRLHLPPPAARPPCPGIVHARLAAQPQHVLGLDHGDPGRRGERQADQAPPRPPRGRQRRGAPARRPRTRAARGPATPASRGPCPGRGCRCRRPGWRRGARGGAGCAGMAGSRPNWITSIPGSPSSSRSRSHRRGDHAEVLGHQRQPGPAEPAARERGTAPRPAPPPRARRSRVRAPAGTAQ